MLSDSNIELDKQTVYLVVAKGQFSGRLAKHPPGAQLPTGTVLSLVIDTQTRQITDWGISDTEPNLSALGSVCGL